MCIYPVGDGANRVLTISAICVSPYEIINLSVKPLFACRNPSVNTSFPKAVPASGESGIAKP